MLIIAHTFLECSHFLFRSYNGPYRTSPEHKGSSQRAVPRSAATNIIFDDSHSKFDNSKITVPEFTGAEDSEVTAYHDKMIKTHILLFVQGFPTIVSS